MKLYLKVVPYLLFVVLFSTSSAAWCATSIQDGAPPPIPGSQDSDPPAPAAGSRDSLKWLPDGAPVSVSNAVVSAVFGGWFYVEKSDRTFGIWISSDDYVEPGQLVDVAGQMATGGGERCIVAQSGGVILADETHTYPLPTSLGMPNKHLGGGEVGLYTPAVGDAAGLNNTGLLVRTWGKVTASYFDYDFGVFYLDDGSNITADLQDPYDPNSDYYIGVKVYDLSWDPLPDVGSYQVVDGISSAEIPQGLTSSIRTLWKVSPVSPSTQAGTTGTILGTVTASGADGTAVHVFCGSASATTTLSSGSTSYNLAVPAGNHAVTASVLGNKTLTKLVTVTNGQTTTQNYTLTSIAKTIDVTSDYTILPHDGASTVEVRIIVRDMEGRRYPNEPITSITLDEGEITSDIPTETDAVGEASFTVQSSTEPETGLITVTCGSLVSHYLLFYANPDEPVIWPELVRQGETVSGDVPLRLHTMDLDAQVTPGGSIDQSLYDQMYSLRSYTFEVDGQEYLQGIPEADGDETTGTLTGYPAVSAFIRTNEFSSGTHTIRVKIYDSDGNYFYSAPYQLVFDNDVYNLSTTSSNPDLPDEVDLLSAGNITISADMKASTTWRVMAYDYQPDNPGNPYPGEIEVASGTGTSIECTWDGKVYPQQGNNQPDIAYVEIQSSSQQVGEGVGRWIGVKVIPDSSVQVLCFTGRPNPPNWKDDGYLDTWPIRTYTLYRKAKDHGWAAKRLGPTQATWARVGGIMGNGGCRLVHGFTHANFGPLPVAGGGTQDFTYIQVQGGFVASRPTLITVGSFSELGLEYTDRLLFVFFDGCFTARNGGGSWPAYQTAPQVSNSARNDMAQVLGMYNGYGYVTKVYMGWHGYSRGDMSWTDFVSSVNSPQGIFGIWCANTGTILSYVVGHYPTGTATPRILKQPNVPSYWPRIQQNLRCFGIGLMGDNDGYKERTFTVIP